MEPYTETQRPGFMYFLTLTLLVGLELVITFVWQHGDQSSYAGHITRLAVLLCVMGVFFLWMRLETRIDEQGIAFRFLPFRPKWKVYQWTELERAYVRKYRSLWEYGGWGRRGNSL